MHPWDAIVRILAEQGIDTVFGIGDTDVQLYAANTPGIRPVNLRFEGSAPFMAMAYSRLTGKPGVCSASSGPGVANLIPGVLEAFSGCVPLVALAPAVSQHTEGMGDFQECDQVGMMKPVTKWSARIPKPDRIPWFLNRAFSIAMNGQPGPVFLEMPYDVGGSASQGMKPLDVVIPGYRKAKKVKMAADPQLVVEAMDMLAQSKRPVVIAGSGVIASGAYQEFRQFVETFRIPFLTTPGGRGVMPESHPLALGTSGIYRTKPGKEVLSQADLMITVGSRNEGFQTHSWNDFPDGAGFIQIDIEPFEIGRNWVPDVGIAGDAGIVLAQLTNAGRQKARITSQEPGRLEALAQAKREFEHEVEIECLATGSPIAAKRVVFETSRVLGKDTILVNENGSQDCWSYCFPYYKVEDGSSCIPVAEQTCMGMGVVGAIAAKIVRPDKKAVCVTGDGAFQMYMKEVPTAVQYKAGCTWVILNNSSFGWIKHEEMSSVGWDTATFQVQPDFAKWAEACGCYGEKVEDPSNIRPALERAFKANCQGTPAILDFIIGPVDMSHFERAI